MSMITTVQAEFLRAAASIVTKKEFDHVLYIGDLPLPSDVVKIKSIARRKLVQAVTSEAQRQVIEAMGTETVALPNYDIARPERFKIALVAGIAKGLFKDGEVVLGMIGRTPTSYPDTLMVVTIGGDDEDSVDTGFGVVGTDRIPSTILESVIDLAVDIARDGWEGHPLGTLLVVGDTSVVMEKSRQLTLNPFQGYSESEKNILNPEVRDAIKNFAVLDGAFVIREDGVVLAAGRYLNIDDQSEVAVPLGLGARHMAAAGISLDTEAIAVVVSETTGVARVFQTGRCVLEIHPEQRTRRGPSSEEAPPIVDKETAIAQLTDSSAPRPGDTSKRPADKEKRAADKEKRPADKDKRPAEKRDTRRPRDTKQREARAKEGKAKESRKS